MDEYKRPYLTLFNAVTDALEQLEQGQVIMAIHVLKEGQKEAENLFVAEGE